MYRLCLNVKEKCPRHPRYNPAEGAAGICGACFMCTALFELYQIAERGRREIEPARREFEQRVNQYLNRRSRPRPLQRAAQNAA